MDERIEKAIKELLDATDAMLNGEVVTNVELGNEIGVYDATVRANDGEIVTFRVTIELKDEDEA